MAYNLPLNQTWGPGEEFSLSLSFYLKIENTCWDELQSNYLIWELKINLSIDKGYIKLNNVEKESSIIGAQTYRKYWKKYAYFNKINCKSPKDQLPSFFFFSGSLDLFYIFY